ncbi:MAG: FHA domain-containing protein [Rhodoglobus sp.]
MDDATEVAGHAAPASPDRVSETAVGLQAPEVAAAVSGLGSASAEHSIPASATTRDETPDLLTSDDAARHRVDHAHAAASSALQLGDPLVLSEAAAAMDVATGRQETAQMSEPTETPADEEPGAQPAVDALTNSIADTGTPLLDDGTFHDEVLPFDEDGPYDEVANPEAVTFDLPVAGESGPTDSDLAPDTSWRDLPAPDPQELTWPTTGHEGEDAKSDETVDAHPAADASEVAEPTDPSDLITASDPTAETDLADVADEIAVSVETDELDDVDASGVEGDTDGDDSFDVRDDADGEPELTEPSETRVVADSDESIVHADITGDVHATSEFDDEQVANETDAESEPTLTIVPDAEPETEIEPEPEPEPLVEPSPLPRSPFEPDLSKVGRPDSASSVQQRFPTKAVRPLGDEAVFTTVDRLRASAFAPVASERVDDQPAPPTSANTEDSDLSEISGTAPRVSGVFGVKPSGVPSESRRGADSTEISDNSGGDLHHSSTRPVPAEAVCAQCGASLSESDIFCGTCGFVKHGVGPTASAVKAPVLDPFPWGSPTAHLEEREPHEQNHQSAAIPIADVDDDAGAGAGAGADVDAGAVAQAEPAGGDPSAREIDAQVSSTTASSDATAESAVASGPDDLPQAIENSDLTHATDDRIDDDGGGELEQLSAVPRLVEPEAQAIGDDESPSETGDSVATPGGSVLAPPPMSHHRVELPISPPMPLSALATDDEDIEDTRIVERTISGTRFVLQFSTGDSVIVTGTGLVGRNPIPEPSEKFDIVVPITDPSKSVSKTHLEFGQMAGAFWITDRYSGNGTVVREPGSEPKRCEPGKRYRVMRGTRVEIGEQFFIVS